MEMIRVCTNRRDGTRARIIYLLYVAKEFCAIAARLTISANISA
jgi:hypothetical protein